MQYSLGNMLKGGGALNPDGLALDLAFALDRSFTTDPAAAGNALITSRRGPTAKFSRGMGATQVNAAGLIEWAPENLMTRSEEFNDASWTKSQVTVNENTTTSPSGIVDADKVVESTATSIHRIVKGSLSAIAGTVYSVSVYAKADGRRYLYLNAGGFGSNSTFDLESGVVSATQNGTASITNAGNGWWRCVTTGTAATTQTTVVNFQLNTTSTASDSSYTGDGTSGIYLWGAQLERASTARTYYPTTTAAFYGPRFDYDPATGASKGLLIEESRTNLVFPSETLTTQTRTVTAVAHTLSFYGTGTVVLSGVHSAIVVGIGSFPSRTTLTFTPTAGSLTLTVTGTVQFAQLEAGAFPLSYIPTTSGTAARSADVCSIIGDAFSSFYNQSEGTLLTDSIPQTVNGTSTVFGVSNGTANERFWNRFAPSEQAVVTSGGVESQLDATNPVAGTRYKIAVAVKLNDLALSLDGAAVVTDTSQPMPTVDRAGIGNPLGVAAGGAMHIARIQYFRKRLSNAKLQTLTTP